MVMIHLNNGESWTRTGWSRANSALLLTIVGGGLAACAFGAIVYDIGHWFAAW
jgi:hypothetical protein